MGSSGTDRELMSAADVGRTISRIAHQIIEKTALDGPDAPRVVLLGIPTRGVTLAARLADKINEFSGVALPHGALDITLYRDDLNIKPPRPLEDDVDPRGRHRRRAGHPRRRRAVLRPLGPLGAGRAARHRPAARRAAGGAGRPRPPRAAAARRLRRQERPDLTQRKRARAVHRGRRPRRGGDLEDEVAR